MTTDPRSREWPRAGNHAFADPKPRSLDERPPRGHLVGQCRRASSVL